MAPNASAGRLVRAKQAQWYIVSIGLLFFVGFFRSIYMISVLTTQQVRVPDELRGRVIGIYGMTYNLLPLGGMFGSILAKVVSAPFAIAVGGAAVAGFAFLNGTSNRQVRGQQSEEERVPAAA